MLIDDTHKTNFNLFPLIMQACYTQIGIREVGDSIVSDTTTEAYIFHNR